jgi:hypothetical protein
MSSVIDKQLNEMSDLGEAQEMAMEAYGALCLTMDYLAYQKYLDGIYKAAMSVVRECNKEGASLEYK